MIAKRSGDNRLGIYKSIIDMLFFKTSFRGADGLSQVEILRAIKSQYKEKQIQGFNLNIFAWGNETLIDLMNDFFEIKKERNLTRVTCFFEQKSNNVNAIYKKSRFQVSELSFL